MKSFNPSRDLKSNHGLRRDEVTPPKCGYQGATPESPEAMAFIKLARGQQSILNDVKYTHTTFYACWVLQSMQKIELDGRDITSECSFELRKYSELTPGLFKTDTVLLALIKYKGELYRPCMCGTDINKSVLVTGHGTIPVELSNLKYEVISEIKC